MEQLDPSIALRKQVNNISETEKESILQDIYDWEDSLAKKEQRLILPECEESPEQNVFLKGEQPVLTQAKRTQLAEAERIKGNEAIRSGDLAEAQNYYTKSIELDSRMAASYCNRALIFLKTKDYDRCIKDASTALRLNPTYVKALLRRGKAYSLQNQLKNAAADLRQALLLEPDCKEASAELSDVLQEMKVHGIKEDHVFTKIAIEEEEEDLEEI
jgi:tetratricopeptide (TPR) repeat protein